MLNLFSNANNPATIKLVIAANAANIEIKINNINLNDDSLEPPYHLPYLQLEDMVFSSNAALRFILPPNPENASKVDEWLEWEATILAPIAVNALTTSKNKVAVEKFDSCLRKLEETFKDQKNLIGDAFYACDIAVWSTLFPLYKDDGMVKKYLGNYEKLVGWLKKLAEEPCFKDALLKYNISANGNPYQVLLNSLKYLSIAPKATESQSPQQLSPTHNQQPPEMVTDEELEQAKNAWKSTGNVQKFRKPHSPILPISGVRNRIITSALPYVNNVPHLGNIIGCVLSSDVFARFCRICNYNTLFIGGTDEYGTATETKALEEGLSCQAICDKYFQIHDDIYKWFNISFDYFGRTSAPQQTELCHDLFLQLNNNGFTFTQSVEQLYCAKCDRYLADRFVEGGCPHPGCIYEDARGDQCDGCGKLVNAIELKQPRCKICKNSPELKLSEQFFLDLPKLEPLLLHWMKNSSPGWSNNAQIISKTWLKEGLKPRCITRDLKWGVPVPLDGYRNKVFYVWFDAPIGYMSITKAYTNEWEKWWRPNQQTNITLYQFMAKDNVPFHSVMFPACLLGANRGYLTVSHIMATEYLNYEDGKFSKSRGVGVFGNNARDTGIPSDVWRFYLLYLRPESQDSTFSWVDLATKTNFELLNNLGNFVNRALMFAKNNFNKTVPEITPTKDDYRLLALCTKELKNYISCLEKCKLRDGIRHILAISRHGNQYMQSNQPWVLLKGTLEEKNRAGTIIGVCCNIACLLAILLHPYMPDTSDNLKQQLNAPDFVLTPENPIISIMLPVGHKLGEPFPLFTKLEAALIEKLKKEFAGAQVIEQKKLQTNGPLLVFEEKDLEEQAQKVRKLKASGIDKKTLQPEIDLLLKIKQVLKEKGESKSKVKKLEDDIAKQGSIVRKMKENGVPKTVWQPEVNKLLDLKKELANVPKGNEK